MNERIRELAEQAGYKPLPGFDFANSLEETYLKKFAELIVQECSRIAFDEGAQAGRINKMERYRGCTTVGKRIEEHFGVE